MYAIRVQCFVRKDFESIVCISYRTRQSQTPPITSDGFEIDAETLGDGVVGKFRKLKALV